MAISRVDAEYLLRRSGFHASTDDIDVLAASATWEAAVDTVLDTSHAPPASEPPALTDPSLSPIARREELVRWWIDLMGTTPCPIVEKMALFFHGFHFVSSFDKCDNPWLAHRQIELFRRHALGDYHQLSQEVAVDPWMLWYLDNHSNRAPDQLNENFGRELLELFTVGPGSYVESDVAAMSRAWSGHGLDETGTTYVFDPSAADVGLKTLFGIERAWTGPEALTEALLGNRAGPSARHLARKLWRYFTSTEASTATVATLAASFRASGLSLRALVRAMFLHPEFRAPATRQAVVLSPVEWFVAMTSSLGMPASAVMPHRFLPQLEQELFRPPNVAGWGTGTAWLSTSRWWQRGHVAWYFAHLAVSSSAPYQVLREVPLDATGAQLTSAALDLFSLERASSATRTVLGDFADDLSGSWAGYSMRWGSIVLVALSPEFCQG